MHRNQNNMTDESWRSLTNMPLFCDHLYSSQSHLVGHLLLTTLRKSSFSLQVPVENEQLELHKTIHLPPQATHGLYQQAPW